MKRALLTTSLILSIFLLSAQDLHVGIFGGMSAYNGDLTDKIFPKKVTNGAVGVTLNYELTDQIRVRSGITYTIVGGADRYSNKPDLLARNLSFETSIIELSILGEYYLFNLHEKKFSPYGFAGLAVFHFNPYAMYGNNQKAYLRPLSTEGQGLTGYSDRKTYSLTQPAIPVGGGIKYVISDKIQVGLEMGIRKLFTDYLDDVSKNYIDPADLLTAKGQLAVDLSYRGDEVTGGSASYPAKGAQRGNPKYKDSYYFGGIHLTFSLGSGNGSGHRSRMGCPANPM